MDGMDTVVEDTESIPDDGAVKSIAALANEQLAAEDEVARLEEQLKRAKAQLSQVQDNLLPTAMASAGVVNFTLTDGSKIAVRDNYRCGQLDDGPQREEGRALEERLEALRWLEDAGHGDLPKRVVSVTMGADSEEMAREIIDLVRSHPGANRLLIDNRRTVPWNTLSAFTREQLREGNDIPLDVLGVTVQRSAKITRKDKEDGRSSGFRGRTYGSGAR